MFASRWKPWYNDPDTGKSPGCLPFSAYRFAARFRVAPVPSVLPTCPRPPLDWLSYDEKRRKEGDFVSASRSSGSALHIERSHYLEWQPNFMSAT